LAVDGNLRGFPMRISIRPLIWLHDGDDVMDIIVPRNTPTEIVVEVQLLTSSSSGFPPRHSDLTAFSMSSVASW
jgi:hypothetical protein